MNKKIILVALLFVIGLFSLIGFYNFGNTQDEQSQDISAYTESTKVASVDYEKIFGYARMDSAIPPLTGIKVEYAYEVNNQSFTGKQTFYRKGFKEIMTGIDNMPESLEIRYKSNKPEESIITIK